MSLGPVSWDAGGSEELADRFLCVVAPPDRDDLSRIEDDPAGLALKTDKAIRPDLRAGQLLVPGGSAIRPDNSGPPAPYAA